METATASSRSLVFKSHYPGDKIIQRAPEDTSIMQKVRISIAWLVLYSITGRNIKKASAESLLREYLLEIPWHETIYSLLGSPAPKSQW